MSGNNTNNNKTTNNNVNRKGNSNDGINSKKNNLLVNDNENVIAHGTEGGSSGTL